MILVYILAVFLLLFCLLEVVCVFGYRRFLTDFERKNKSRIITYDQFLVKAQTEIGWIYMKREDLVWTVWWIPFEDPPKNRDFFYSKVLGLSDKEIKEIKQEDQWNVPNEDIDERVLLIKLPWIYRRPFILKRKFPNVKIRKAYCAPSR